MTKPKLQNWLLGDVPEACIPIGNSTPEEYGEPAGTECVRARTAEEAIDKAEAKQVRKTNAQAMDEYVESLKKLTGAKGTLRAGKKIKEFFGQS